MYHDNIFFLLLKVLSKFEFVTSLKSEDMSLDLGEAVNGIA